MAEEDLSEDVAVIALCQRDEFKNDALIFTGPPLSDKRGSGHLGTPGTRHRGLPHAGPRPRSAVAAAKGSGWADGLGLPGRAIQSPLADFPPLARSGVSWIRARARAGGASPGYCEPPRARERRMRGRPASPLRRSEPRRRREASDRAVRDRTAARGRWRRTGGEPSPVSPGALRPLAESRGRSGRGIRRWWWHPGRPVRDAPPTAPRRLTAPALPRGAPQPGPRPSLRPSPARCHPAAAPAGLRPARPCGPPRRRRNTA